MKNSQITFLQNVRAPHQFSKMALDAALKSIKNKTYKALIEKLRTLPKSDPAYKKLKTNLPSFAFNGTFTGSVINDNFCTSSGVFCCDIDVVRLGSDLETDKKDICKLPYVGFCFTSPSGEGLKVGIRIDPKWVVDDNSFKEIYARIEAELLKYGFTLDKSCKDVRRPCFVSYDPEIYINYDAELFVEQPLSWRERARLEVEAQMAMENSISGYGYQCTGNPAVDSVGIVVNMLKSALAGARHGVRLKAGRTAGGYVAGGWVDQDVMMAALRETSDKISTERQTSASEWKAILDAFEEGKLKPIALPDSAADQAADMGVIDRMFEKMKNDNLAWTEPEVLDELLKLQDDINGFAKLSKKLKDHRVGEGKLKEALKKHGAKNKSAGASQSNVTTSQYIVEDGPFSYSGRDYDAGVYYTKPINNKSLCRICSPLHVGAITITEDGKGFGRLLRFLDTNGAWREWAMPMGMLSGSCEELRHELLSAGVEVEHKNRDELPGYLQSEKPEATITAATRTGWTERGDTFVFHDKVVGSDKVFFQSESTSIAGSACFGGDYVQWQNMAKLCERNPVFALSLCVSLSGVLLERVNGESGGVHFHNDSSTGKTTAIRVGASIWGDKSFMRSWRATSNGIEGVAASLTDTCICLDEISQASKKEIGEIAYTLGNGVGKSRATRVGGSRKASSWRLSILSSGEKPVSEMIDGQVTAGQELRLLEIPAGRKFGCCDSLEGFEDGRALVTHVKNQCAEHYGHAGVKFIETIIGMGDANFARMLVETEKNFDVHDSQTSRVATRFALYALAGEIAIKAGILPWRKGSAVKICVDFYKVWCEKRGTGNVEHTQILESLNDYLDKFGETKFTFDEGKLIPIDQTRSIDRAGWFKTAINCTKIFDYKKFKIDPTEVIYFFTSTGLKAAIGDYSIERAIKALEEEGWLVVRDKKQASKSLHVGGQKRRVYVIRRKIS